jgi:hypothetical protein
MFEYSKARRRRDFVKGIAGSAATAWPLAARLRIEQRSAIEA